MRRNIIFFIALASLIPCQIMAQSTASDPAENSSTGLIVLLTFCLLILVILTLWLLKNSYRLKETVENPGINGEVWLNRHIRDLENHQLDILIKRHPLASNDSLKDEKPNE